MKKLLLSAVVLLSVGLNAQETGGVGINTENPKATLDVNGDARLQKVELMTMSTPAEETFPDCPCVLTIDKKGVIKRIPKEKFVLTDGSTNSGTPPTTTTYSATKSYTATGTYKNQNCGSGKVAEDYPVSHTASVTLTSDESQENADKKALDEATRLSEKWVAENGQVEANKFGTCKNTEKHDTTDAICYLRYGKVSSRKPYADSGVWVVTDHEDTASDEKGETKLCSIFSRGAYLDAGGKNYMACVGLPDNKYVWSVFDGSIGNERKCALKLIGQDN